MEHIYHSSYRKRDTECGSHVFKVPHPSKDEERSKKLREKADRISQRASSRQLNSKRWSKYL